MAFIGSVIDAVGQVTQAIAQKKAAEVQAQVSDTNAVIADQAAKRAIAVGQVNQQEQDLATKALVGQQFAVQGASGVEVNVGSPVQARMAAKRLGRLDALRIRQNAGLEAKAYRVAAYGYRTDADLLRQTGRSAIAGGVIGAGGSLLTGAARAASGNYITLGSLLK